MGVTLHPTASLLQPPGPQKKNTSNLICSAPVLNSVTLAANCDTTDASCEGLTLAAVLHMAPSLSVAAASVQICQAGFQLSLLLL